MDLQNMYEGTELEGILLRMNHLWHPQEER
jgi:hypothetical protein